MKLDFNAVQLSQSGGLAYLDRPGPEMPILFLHGNGFSKEVFANQFVSKWLASHRLIAVDLPGHGDSANAREPEKTYTYAGFAEEVCDFVYRLEIPRCLIAGWSLGGQVALEMLDDSQTIAGVMAFGAPPAPSGAIGLVKAMHFSRTLLLAGKAKFSIADATYFEKECLREFSDGRFFKTLMRTDPAMRPMLSRSVLSRNGISQQEKLNHSMKPVCLLHGKHDPLVRSSYMEGLNAPALFGGKAFVLDDAAHAPFLECQDVFDCLLREFTVYADRMQVQAVAGKEEQKAAASAE